MGNSSAKETNPRSLRPHVLRTQSNGSPRSAVLMGPTGATGKFILSYLICSPEWERVTIVHRREVNLDEIAKDSATTFSDEQKAKVVQHVLDMEKLCENEEAINKNAELFKGHDVTICVLGTTRSQAKTAENFRKVDHYMVRDGGILSLRAGVPHFSLLTSKGANAGLWANDWKITHGLLYLRVKGDAEQSIIDLKFPRTSIFRPGVLGRDGSSGGAMGKLSVRDLAAAIVYDAESDEIAAGKAEDVDSEPAKKEEQKVEEDDKEKNEEEEEAQNQEKEKGDEEQEEENKQNDENVAADEKAKKKEDGVEKVMIYESGDIDNMLVLAQKNYNAVVCVTETKTVEEEKEQKEEVQDKQEEAVVKQEEIPKEEPKEEPKEKPKEKPKEEENEKEKNDEEVNDEEESEPKQQDEATNAKEETAENEDVNNLDGAKYEVVEKPQEAEAEDLEDEPKHEDFVEVQSEDATKEKADDEDEQ